MGKIVISENVSLDGVIEDPTGVEGLRVGGWFWETDRGADGENVHPRQTLGTEALLLGRRSYEFFAATWPSRGGELADELNSLPKYVVSSTLEDPDWNNSTVLTGDVVDEVSKLKQELDGEIVVLGSPQLARTLIEHDLVDELRLVIYPVCSGPARAYSARPATRNPCAWSTPKPLVTASPSSPTSPSMAPNERRTAPAGQARGRSPPGGHPGERWATKPRPREELEIEREWRVAGLAVRSLLQLLDEHPARVRKCANPDCPFWFLDTTRSGTRRWCSMTVCGNRLKARRHYRRQQHG